MREAAQPDAGSRSNGEITPVGTERRRRDAAPVVRRTAPLQRRVSSRRRSSRWASSRTCGSEDHVGSTASAHWTRAGYVGSKQFVRRAGCVRSTVSAKARNAAFLEDVDKRLDAVRWHYACNATLLLRICAESSCAYVQLHPTASRWSAPVTPANEPGGDSVDSTHGRDKPTDILRGPCDERSRAPVQRYLCTRRHRARFSSTHARVLGLDHSTSSWAAANR